MSSEQAAELIRLGRAIELGVFLTVLALFGCVALLGFILAYTYPADHTKE